MKVHLSQIKNKSLLIIAFFILSFSVNAQFLDFNLFKPSVSASAQQVFLNENDSLAFGVNDYQFSALIPIKSKFAVDLNFDNIFKSKGIKDAFKKMATPKFSQTFVRFGGGYRTLESKTLRNRLELYNFSAGITGTSLQLKSGKFRFLMYSLNVRLQEQLGKYKTISPSISGLFGAAKIFDYRTGIFYGIYGNYFGKRIIPFPVFAYYYKMSRNSSFLFVFPYQIQTSFKLADKVNLNFTVSANTFSSGVYNDSIIPKQSMDRLNFTQASARFSSQARFELGKKIFLYLEGGWQDANRAIYFDGYDILQFGQFRGNAFIKAKITMVLGRSLFNSSVFDVDL